MQEKGGLKLPNNMAKMVLLMKKELESTALKKAIATVEYERYKRRTPGVQEASVRED